MLLRELSLSIKFSIVTASLGVFGCAAALLIALCLPNTDQKLANLSNVAITVASLVTIIALAATAIGVFLTYKQLSITRRIALGEFLLHVDEMMLGEHKEVYYNLRPRGAWQDKELTSDEIDKVVPYAGLFERIKVHMDNGIVDLEIIQRLYSYRILELLRNKSVVKYIFVDFKYGWQDFINLCEKLRRIDPELDEQLTRIIPDIEQAQTLNARK